MAVPCACANASVTVSRSTPILSNWAALRGAIRHHTQQLKHVRAEQRSHDTCAAGRGDFAAELTAGTQSPTLIRVANENENLQDLLLAGLHDFRPPIIEPEPTPPKTALGTSPMDQLVELLALATNQAAESDNAEAMVAREDRNRILAAAINEAIQQEEPRAD